MKIIKISEDYWRVQVGNAVVGNIQRENAASFWKPAEYTYTFRSSYTVAGEGRRVFGSVHKTFENAGERARNCLDVLANMIKENE